MHAAWDIPSGIGLLLTLQLNNENKISTKNAFDLKMIDHLGEMTKMFMKGGQIEKYQYAPRPT